MKNLKTFKVYEGDWWDNDPSAPWNQPDPPEPEAGISYTEAQQDFKTLVIASDSAILRKKGDGTMWVLEVTDIQYDEDFTDYLHYYDVGDDETERFEGMEEDEYASIATDLFKENKWKEGKEAWDNRDAERLFKIDLELAEELIHDFVEYSKPRTNRAWRPNQTQMKENRLAANLLSKAFPEAEED